jgi:hypothetical protein
VHRARYAMEHTYNLGQHALEITEHTVLIAAHPTEDTATTCCVVALSTDEAWKLYVALHELFGAAQQEECDDVQPTDAQRAESRAWKAAAKLASTPGYQWQTHENKER